MRLRYEHQPNRTWIRRGQAVRPPKTTIECALPLNDAVGRWTTGAGLFKKLPPNWAGGFSSTLYSQAPVIAYFSDSNENRGIVACSEALRRVNFEMGIVEESAQSSCKVSLFSESEPPRLLSCAR